MSLRLPSTTVKLPFNAPQLTSNNTEHGVKRTYTTSQIEQTICGICGKKQSKYVCPRCNVFYCSLDCFRDEKHAQCSESFYASAIREAIRSDGSSSSDEKQKMMEMLARFERGASEGGGSGDGSSVNGLEELLKGMGGLSQEDEGRGARIVEENEDDEDGFEALEALKVRLSDNPDLESMAVQDLVNLLPPAHRDQFLSLLSNPDADRVQRLLDSMNEADRKEVENESLPWFLTWNREQISEEEDEDVHHIPLDARTTLFLNPAPTTVTEELKVNPAVAIKLVYNTLAICMAYVHLLVIHALPSLQHISSSRLSAFDADQRRTKVLDEFLDLVPFLGDKESSLRFTSMKEAWESIWSRIGSRQSQEDHKANGRELITMLENVQKILVPSLDLGKASEHGVNLVLSDLYGAFSATDEVSWKSKSKSVESGSISADRPKLDKRHQKRLLAVAKKLVFYLGALQAIRQDFGRKVWLDLDAEFETTILKLKSETEEVGKDVQGPTVSKEGAGLAVETTEELSTATRLQTAPVTEYNASPRPRARIEEL